MGMFYRSDGCVACIRDSVIAEAVGEKGWLFPGSASCDLGGLELYIALYPI